MKLKSYAYKASGSNFFIQKFLPTVSFSVYQESRTATAWARVIRMSDNAEADIGFLNGAADITALQSFVGSADAYYCKIYDQAGSNHLLQATVGNMCKAATAGVLTLSLGLPTFLFNGTSTFYTLTTPFAIASLITSVKLVSLVAGTGYNNPHFGASTSYGYDCHVNNMNYLYMWGKEGYIRNPVTASASEHVLSGHFNAAGGSMLYYDSTSVGASYSAFASNAIFNNVGKTFGAINQKGSFSAMHFCNYDASANFVAMRTELINRL